MNDRYKLLVVLQNPYDKGELAKGYHPLRWRGEFERSRSGFRLRDAIPRDWDTRIANANPKIGVGASSRLAADLPHLRRVLKRVAPDFVLACGKTAETAMLALWPGPLLAVPHPASRVLTDALYLRCRNLIGWWGYARGWPESSCSEDARRMVSGVPRLALRQLRGESQLVDLS